MNAITCGYCKSEFRQKVSWQKYCSDACRGLSNQLIAETGIQARVAGNSIAKNGATYVTLYFAPDRRSFASALAPGMDVGVVIK